LTRHQCCARFIDKNPGNRLARSLVYLYKLSGVEACGTCFSADPHRTMFVSLEGENSARGQGGIVDRLRSASVKPCESCVSTEPHRAVRSLRNRMHAIRRQTVKQRDCTPLMQTSDRRR